MNSIRLITTTALILLSLQPLVANGQTVTTVLPPNGYTGGKTAVTIVGSGFTGATAVTLGGVAVTGLTVVTDGMITATTGVHAAGAVSVMVTTPGGLGTGAGLYTYGALPVAAGAAWLERSSAGARAWYSITSSADGSKLAAVVSGGDIWTSTDGGATWTDRSSAGVREWASIASSADGSKLAAVDAGSFGNIWTSTDGGATWTDRSSAGAREWQSIASSADGSKLAAVASGDIWTSTDGGATWIDRSSAGSRTWASITSSADGSKLAAVDAGGTLGDSWTSTDGGATWTDRTSAGARAWYFIASSADGSKLAAADGYLSGGAGDIWTSTDGGATWTDRTSAGVQGERFWISIASSADGSKLAAVELSHGIWTSTDGGATWTDRSSAGAGEWCSIASSADGSKLAAVESLGDIWTSASTPPVVNITVTSTTVNPGASVTFTVNVTGGSAPFNYQWRKNGVKITGATKSIYALSNVQKAAEGSYDVQVTNSFGTATADAATLNVNDPVVIVFPPISQAANVGDPVTLSVTPTGTAPLSYQWRLNTTPVDGETNPTLSFTADSTNGGNYDVVVTNVVGSATSKPATVTILAPPMITSPPTDQLVNAGAQVLFSVTATGDSLIYQWRRNGVALAGKTGSFLLLSNAQAANVGNYDVVVKNSYGTVISSPAALQLIALLNITSQPADVTANVGDTATFSVTASGPGVLAYQWYKKGQTITGAKSATLTVPVTDGSAAGVYTVMVTTGTLKATSTPASLRVSDGGLLLYNVIATGTTVQAETSTAVAVTGTLVLDRANQRGGLIWFGKSGTTNTFRTEINENLRTHSTGPVASSVTVITRVTETGTAPDMDENLLWLKGTDSLLTISTTDKTVGPQTIAGTLNSLVLDNGTQVQALTLTGVLDAASSGQARQSSETVERTINRLAVGWQFKGYAPQ